MDPVPDPADPSRATHELPVVPVRETVVFPLTIAPAPIDRGVATRALVERIASGGRRALLVAVRGGVVAPARPEQLYALGTSAVVHDVLEGPDGVVRIAVEGVERARIVAWVQREPALVARVRHVPDLVEPAAELDPLLRSARELFARFMALVTELSSDLLATVGRVSDPRQLVYLLASTTPMTTAARQLILEEPSVAAKLRATTAHLRHDVEVRELMQRIAGGATATPAVRPSGAERDAAGRRSGEPAGREAADAGRDRSEAGELRERLAGLGVPEEVRREIDREVDRLERTPPASPEHAMIRTYVDWILKLPWTKATGGTVDVAAARDALDRDHQGLADVKRRIVEHLAVLRLRAERREAPGGELVRDAGGGDGEAREPILCLVGPPGVGKTSLGRSIARALGRKLARVALGGIHDEAEMRGHRRTYVGAMPGRIIQALARCGACDPVFVLDEVDKLGVGFHGDPSAALLEVLDPAQNHAFVDSYLGVPFDLSRVLFVCTANAPDAIPAPLLDRMEVLRVPGYTETEKVLIAQRHLVPRALAAHGLRPGEVAFGDDAVRRIVRGYTREAGVRGLGRGIGAVLRKVACDVVEGGAGAGCVGAEAVSAYLGAAPFEDAAVEPIDRSGVAVGLAWLPTGGEVLFVEAAILPGDGDSLILTGMLGPVMQESARAALSYLRSNAERLGVDPRVFERKTVHVHVPAGALPKDGPSAGVCVLVAIASQAIGRPARGDVGMTGEITLRGRVLPVGGLKEKVLAAHRAGLRAVVVPRGSEAQLADVPSEVRSALRIVSVDSAEEVLATALGLGGLGDRLIRSVAEHAPASVH